ncbi:MAG: hypothetical protein ACKO85_18370 [Isosphaeraceae bacterium]
MISEKVARNIIFQLIVSACILAGSGCAKNKALQVNNRPIIEGGSTIGAESAPGSIIVNKPAPRTGFVDRHPFLYKPGEYYSTSDGNVVVKGARATFIGIPAGIVGEFKQAFKGVPKTIIIQ